MKKLFNLLAIVPVIFSSLALVNVSALETAEAGEGESLIVDEEVQDDFYVAADNMLTIKRNIGGDLFASGADVTVQEQVGGDVYIAGGSITLEKPIMGDVFVAGGNVTINESIAGSVYVASGMVDINGAVYEDVMVFAGQVKLNGQVYDDVRVFSGLAEIKQDVQGDVIAFAGNVNLDGDVGGDVHIGAGNANVKSGYIGGDLVTYNNTQLDLSEDTVVSGERIEKTTSAEKDMNFPGLAELSFVSFVWKFVWNLVQGVGLILLAFLVYKLAPVKFERALMQLKNAEQQLKSFGVGCLVFPLGILVSIFLLISVVGWPILGLLLALAFIAKTLTTVFVGTKVGILILKPLKLKRPVLFGIIAGILLVQLLTAIPFIGGAVEFLVFFVGIGAIVRAQYFKYKESKGARKGNRSGDRNDSTKNKKALVKSKVKK